MQNADQLSQVPSGGFNTITNTIYRLEIHSQVKIVKVMIFTKSDSGRLSLFTVSNYAQLTFSEFENQVSEQEQKLQLSRNSLPMSTACLR